MQDELLGASDATAFLGVSRQRLKQLREKGAIEAVKMGNYYFYPKRSLEKQKQHAEPYRLKDSAGTLAAVSPA